MSQPEFISLNYFFDKYKSNFSIQIIRFRFNELLTSDSSSIDSLIKLYMDGISLIEQRIWADNMDAESLQHYQALFHDLESLHENNDQDRRHQFIVIIPVADRPQHLKSCLQSLLNVCQYFKYGGFKDNKFSKLSVLIADDSKQTESIQANQAMLTAFIQQGLEIEYFGLLQQKQLVAELLSGDNSISNIIGNIDQNLDSQAFYHKGASIMRNIAYLKLNQMQTQHETQLFYFVDSDQEFQVQIHTDEGDKELYAVNYFYYLDRIFFTTDVRILTGKVVGDPPVSPAVMAANFIDDLTAFISTMSALQPEQSCQFHRQDKQLKAEASYHDMADLFGFKSSIDSYPYRCEITGKHNNVDCFSDFSNKVSKFFDGEHPTRKSYFQHEDVLANIEPARTIYTGNYVFKPEALKYFIPFADLKLRMAGPVLGRIIKAEIGDQFVSANLPMLHKRTVASTGQSEFRPGIERQQDMIDLSGEYCRQFFGDVMLFSMEKLTAMGYPLDTLSAEVVSQTINSTIFDMQDKYRIKHEEILIRIKAFKSLMNASQHWWNTNEELRANIQNYMNFIINIDRNFGETAFAFAAINSTENTEKYHHLILNAIISYDDDTSIWQTILKKNIN